MKHTYLALLLAQAVIADLPLTILGEGCPQINWSQKLTNDQLPNFTGLWYNIAHTKNWFQNSNAFCPTANYTFESLPIDSSPDSLDLSEVSSRLLVENSQVDPITLIRDTTTGYADFIQPGNLNVIFNQLTERISNAWDALSGESFSTLPEVGNYFILDSDENFSEYIYVYSCSDNCLGNFCLNFSPKIWVLTIVLTQLKI